MQWWRKLLLRPLRVGRIPNSVNLLLPSSKSKANAIRPNVTPQRNYRETVKLTPNVSARKIRPELIVLHHTDGSYAGSVAWCLNPSSRVSYHCIIARDGSRTILAQPNQRTWHAGKSSYKGRRDVNSFSVGVAFSGNTYIDALETDAIDSCLEYVIPLMQQYEVSANAVTDHRTIAPGRKVDIEPHQLAALQWKIKNALAP